jgi:hypothetical protein
MNLNTNTLAYQGVGKAKKYWASRGHETFGAKLSLPPVLIFPERLLQPIAAAAAAAMCTVTITVLEPRAFNLEYQYFIPLFSKISLLCGQQPGEDDETSNEGCNSGPTQTHRADF